MNRNIGNEHCDKNTNYLSCVALLMDCFECAYTQSTKQKHGKQNTEGRKAQVGPEYSLLDEHSVDN